MAIFERNMAVLRRREPALAARMEQVSLETGLSVEPARNGEPTLKRNGIWLHSPYDPTKEAASWAEGLASGSERVTVLGCGLGYHLKALSERGRVGTFIEADPAVFRAALANLDLSDVLERFDPLVGVSREAISRVHGDLLAGETVSHPASVQMDPDYLGQIESYGKALSTVREGALKILVVNPIMGGSLPAAHHCAAALRRLGHDVDCFASESFNAGFRFGDRFAKPENRNEFQKNCVSLLSHAVELQVQETNPDLVLILAQAPLLPATLARLRTWGIPTAYWFVEDYQVFDYWREIAPACSYFFGIQKGRFLTELDKAGVQNYGYLPAAAESTVHTPLVLNDEEREEYGSPLSFVGAGYFNRQRFFRSITDYNFRIWGSEWPLVPPLDTLIQRNSARIDTETSVKIFNASDVNLNLHSSTYREGVNPDGDFVNPRTFELASCSAFQLVDRRSLLPDLFADDELETFSDLTELRGKIDHFLGDPEGRRDVADRGRKRVLSEHTYEKRMEELLATMLQAFPAISEKRSQRQTQREALMTELGSGSRLQGVVEKLTAGKTVSLEDIWRGIDGNEGALSRAERIFLMLKNIEIMRGNKK